MASDEPCLIASKSAVRGQISGKQDLIVEGRVEGRIGLESHLTIEESGSVEADMEVSQVTVKGEARGDVVAARSAVLHATARFHHPVHAMEWADPDLEADYDAVITLILRGLTWSPSSTESTESTSSTSSSPRSAGPSGSPTDHSAGVKGRPPK